MLLTFRVCDENTSWEEQIQMQGLSGDMRHSKANRTGTAMMKPKTVRRGRAEYEDPRQTRTGEEKLDFQASRCKLIV
jgi:hypothetical protein